MTKRLSSRTDSEALDNRAFLVALYAILCNGNRKQAFYDLCDLYTESDDEQRQFTRKHYPFGEMWEPPQILTFDESYKDSEADMWPFYSDLPSDLPEEAPADQRIRAALILYSIRGGIGDIRDDHLELSIIFTAALAIHWDASFLFSEIAMLSAQGIPEEKPWTMRR